MFGLESKEEEFWGGCKDEDLSENKWHKDEEREAELAMKPFNPMLEIPLSDEDIAQWSKPWKNTLIVKVLGKRVNFGLLEVRLRCLL